jgi:hypothetical protein
MKFKKDSRPNPYSRIDTLLTPQEVNAIQKIADKEKICKRSVVRQIIRLYMGSQIKRR